MRCPSCGTENAHDSRFCGGCGARLVSEQRLAPTHKISDDARWDNAQPSTAAAPVTPASVPRKHPASAPPGTYQVPVRTPTNPLTPANVPRSPSLQPSIPPVQQMPMSMPPASSAPRSAERPGTAPVAAATPIQRSSGQRIVQPAPAPAPAQRASAKTLEPPPTRWGLIMLVLLIDIGLAAAGVGLLREGLREAPTNGSGSGSSTAAEPAKTPPTEVVAQTPTKPDLREQITPPPPTKDEARKDDSAPGPGSAATPPPVDKAPPASNRARTQKIHITSRKQGSAGSPLDPYGEPEPAVSLATQVDRLFVHSKPAFDGCYTAIAKSLPPDQTPRGTIKISFRVIPDGRVERVIALENGTGNEPLAGCLIAEIGAWVLPAHGGDGIDFVRAINF